MQLLTSDITVVTDGVGESSVMIVQYIITFVAGLAVGFVIDWEFTLFIVYTTPFLPVTSFLFWELRSVNMGVLSSQTSQPKTSGKYSNNPLKNT